MRPKTGSGYRLLPRKRLRVLSFSGSSTNWFKTAGQTSPCQCHTQGSLISNGRRRNSKIQVWSGMVSSSPQMVPAWSVIAMSGIWQKNQGRSTRQGQGSDANTAVEASDGVEVESD